MYSLIQAIPLKQLLIEQVPVIVLSLIIAEVFYKFHSFTLEAVAFLLTWFVLDAVVRLGVRSLARRRDTSK